MRVYYPGRNVIPVALLVAAFVLILSRFNPSATPVFSLWPLAVIAAGVEELILWSNFSVVKRVKGARQWR